MSPSMQIIKLYLVANTLRYLCIYIFSLLYFLGRGKKKKKIKKRKYINMTIEVG